MNHGVYSSTSKPTSELAKEAAVQLVIDNQNDYKIMNEATKRVTNILERSGCNSELFRYKLQQLKHALEQVKIHL
jgi:D-arabinose 5-phosphate isomerase GutQ